MIRRARRGLAAAAGAVWLLLCAWASPAVAQSTEPESAECCHPLLLPIGARTLGLGGAVSARSAPGALFVNPSLLADVAEDQFVIHNANTDIEVSNTFSVIIRSEVAGTFGVSYRLIDLGDQEHTDENGIPVGFISVTTHVITATYATRVAGGLSAGVSYQLYQERNDCRGFCNNTETKPGTTHAVNLGVQFAPDAAPSLRLGGALVNLGYPLQVVNSAQASPMPLRIRAGAAYEAGHHFLADSTFTVWASADAVVNPRDGSMFMNIGADLSIEDLISIRVGYGGGGDYVGGVGIGLGLTYDRFTLDIARTLVVSPIDESSPTQISFAIRF